jgi:hypothetical protein
MMQTEFTLDEWWTYAKHESFDVRFSILRTSIPIEILEYLANDKHWYIRMFIASNPRTPVKILKHLALDITSCVRVAVFHNPSATEEVRITHYAGMKYKHLLIR